MKDQERYQDRCDRILRVFEQNRVKRPMMIFDLPDKQNERDEQDGFLFQYLRGLPVDAVFAPPNGQIPAEEEIAAAAEAFRTQGCDFLVAAGGAPAIHFAKAVRYALFSGRFSTNALPPEQRDLWDPLDPRLKTAVFPVDAAGGEVSSGFLFSGADGAVSAAAHPSLTPDVLFSELRALDELAAAQKKDMLLRLFCGCASSLWASGSDKESRSCAADALKAVLHSATGFLLGDRACSVEISRASALCGRARELSGESFIEPLGGTLALHTGLPHPQATGFCLLSLWRYVLENPRLISAPLRRAFEKMKEFFPLRTGSDGELLEYAAFFLGFLGCKAAPEEHSPDRDKLRELIAPLLPAAPAALDAAELAGIAADAPLRESAAEKSERGELRELQQLELEILLETDRFCKRHGITYFLGEGTMLGAMRHGGFIPWDDDVDLLMPRRDYDRFIRLARENFPAGYNLDSFETNPRHWVLGAKIQMTRKTRFYQTKSAECAMYNGPYIDIFPLDYIGPKHKLYTRLQFLLVRFLRRFLFIKTGFSLAMNRKPQRYALRFLSRFVPTSALFGWISAAMRLQNRGKRNFMVNFCSYYNLQNQSFPARFFESAREVPFEGHLLPVPAEADYMMKTIYGKDYMLLPPAAVRGSRVHDFSVDRDFAAPVPPRRAAYDGPRVSVIVPVYNVEEYLPKCLDSLLAQTLEDMEIIVVNDGSPDGSQAVIERYAQAHPDQIRAFVKENGGIADTRNFGVSKARGEYIGFVDSDDYALPELFEKLLAKADDTGADVAVCRIERVSRNQRKVQSMPHRSAYGASVSERPELILAAKPYVWNKIYRRSLFEGILFPARQHFEDSAVVYNLLLKANRIELVDEALYCYVTDRDGSITNTPGKRFYDIFRSCDSIVRFYRENGAWERCRAAIEEQCRTLIFVRINAVLRSADEKMRRAFIRDAYRYLGKNFPRWRKNPYYKALLSGRRSRMDRLGRHPFLLRLMLRAPRRLLQAAQRRYLGVGRRANTLLPEDIRALQQIQLGILDVIDRFCAEHGLTYYLAEGTLLGAVRHRGFIPWDDDTDIAMPRADYEKFRALFAGREIDGCVLLDETVYEPYHLTFAKIVTTRETGYRNTKDRFPEKFRGPYVDIFPLDRGVSQDSPRRVRKIRKYRDILLLKVRYIRPNTKRRMVCFFLKGFYSYRGLQKILRRLMTRYDGKPGADYLVNYASSYPPSRETAPADAYGAPVLTEFEGRLRPVPQNADLILRTIYGDYTRLPPPGKRSGKHSIVKKRGNRA